MTRNPFAIISLYVRALSSARKAIGLSDVAMMFNRFGRQHGWKLIWRLSRAGFAYLINPVSSFRYFEFPFALSSLPLKPGRCLDVSSPNLFSFYVSQKCHPTSIWMINPDKKDIQHSTRVVEKLKISNIRTDCNGVDVLEGSPAAFDSIWAISVVEHISGKYDDSYAVRLMYNALAPGGHLILTVPVDRQFWEDYRDQAYYSIPKEQSKSGSYFFQRLYDEAAIRKRLIDFIGVEPSSVRWFGEKRVGHYFEYEKQWLKEGFEYTFDDPREISENYQEFSSWDMMPGMGVCGLLFIKPREG
jgi:SAM-dependent methyltransferase